jgi:hypothetical protein
MTGFVRESVIFSRGNGLQRAVLVGFHHLTDNGARYLVAVGHACTRSRRVRRLLDHRDGAHIREPILGGVGQGRVLENTLRKVLDLSLILIDLRDDPLLVALARAHVHPWRVRRDKG